MKVLVFIIFVFCVVFGFEIGWLEIRVNSCIGPLKFNKCVDLVGEFIDEPTKLIGNYSRGTWKVKPKSGISEPTFGNCTYTYTNSKGSHIAYFGDQIIGGGTSDVEDHEITDMSTKGSMHAKACFWLYYEGNWMDCYVKTGENECPQPSSMKNQHIKKPHE